MSVPFLRLLICNLRTRLLLHHLKTGYQLRTLTAMELAEDKDTEVLPTKNYTRYKNRCMKRQWEDTKKENGETDEKKVCDKPFERIKRKKMAILMGYCGVDYFGMQRNPGVKTIEEDLFKALCDAKYVTEEDFNNQQNTQFQRSSRTDKGVSAARQVVSLKLPLEANKEVINKGLPECIRVFGVKRVTNKFNSKVKCNARTYSYTLPTFAFEPSVVNDEERQRYRITKEKLEQVNKVLEVYKGTKSYHNFTEKKYYTDPSASRYMMGFSIDKVFVKNDMEFAVLLVKGQSFMLHQIRKMVGLTIAIVRGHTDMTILDRAFSKEKTIIPTVPGLGLVLDMVHYDKYDAKFKSSHESLTWDEEEETVQKFKHEYIYPNIVKGEIEGKSMSTWIDTRLSLHSYDLFEEIPEDKLTGEIGGKDKDSVETEGEKETDSVESEGEKGADSVETEGEKEADSVETEGEKRTDSVESEGEKGTDSVETSSEKEMDTKVTEDNSNVKHGDEKVVEKSG